jgi:hypothetical protein
LIGGALGIPLETFWSIQTWRVAIAGEVLVLFISGPSPCSRGAAEVLPVSTLISLSAMSNLYW